jgi:hypothetical protein
MSLSWGDVGKAIQTVQPEADTILKIAGMIPGVGTVTGAAQLVVDGLAKAFGTDPTPDAITQAIQTNPDAAIKLKELETQVKMGLINLQIAQIQADTAQMQTVNTTMQEETKASANEAWYQKAWRPACGFCVALGSFIPICAICYIFYAAIKDNTLTASLGIVLNVIPQLALSIATLLTVPGAAVGITAWHKGMMQREAQTNGDTEPIKDK